MTRIEEWKLKISKMGDLNLANAISDSEPDTEWNGLLINEALARLVGRLLR